MKEKDLQLRPLFLDSMTNRPRIERFKGNTSVYKDYIELVSATDYTFTVPAMDYVSFPPVLGTYLAAHNHNIDTRYYIPIIECYDRNGFVNEGNSACIIVPIYYDNTQFYIEANNTDPTAHDITLTVYVYRAKLAKNVSNN